MRNKGQKPLREILENHLMVKLTSLYDRKLLSSDINLNYIYEKDTFINISANATQTVFEYGDKINNFFNEKANLTYPVDETAKNALSKELGKLFQDDMETVYIPAGRITVSLLSEQLNYIFMSMDDIQRRTMDYCVRKYFELVLQIKLWCEKINPAIINIDTPDLNKAITGFYQKIIKAVYMYKNFEEHLVFGENQSIKLNFASSGQQEAVWILNILNYFSAVNKKVFLIIEEPEAHLYPESQMYMTDLMALFINGGHNAGLITTHSPYILGEFNNLILCGQAKNEGIDKISITEASDIDERAWFKKDILQAFYAIDGKCENAIIDGLIMNELIDGASEKIDNKCYNLIDLFHGGG